MVAGRKRRPTSDGASDTSITASTDSISAQIGVAKDGEKEPKRKKNDKKPPKTSATDQHNEKAQAQSANPMKVHEATMDLAIPGAGSSIGPGVTVPQTGVGDTTSTSSHHVMDQTVTERAQVDDVDTKNAGSNTGQVVASDGLGTTIFTEVEHIMSMPRAKEVISKYEARIRELEMERDRAWSALQWTNRTCDLMLSNFPLERITGIFGRLCGRFATDPIPTIPHFQPTFYDLLDDLARAVDSRPPNLFAPAPDGTIDIIFIRALRVLMGPWDPLRPLRTVIMPQDRVPAFAPPDVLWTLVHLGDPILYVPLINAIQMSLNACPDTQRGMALLLTLGRLQRGKMMMGITTKEWAKWQSGTLEARGWRLDESVRGSLKRVTNEEIDGALVFFAGKRHQA
ncbi:hypothetical protein IAR55_001637 [Kwoniella newhampshirensis]|uniref:Uncharacterized protein n=1 Tax=Kwoniella newhampshirensis TaxID=1651941 RepID=A0AAW0Z2W9_9TREE